VEPTPSTSRATAESTNKVRNLEDGNVEETTGKVETALSHRGESMARMIHIGWKSRQVGQGQRHPGQGGGDLGQRANTRANYGELQAKVVAAAIIVWQYQHPDDRKAEEISEQNQVQDVREREAETALSVFRGPKERKSETALSVFCGPRSPTSAPARPEGG